MRRLGQVVQVGEIGNVCTVSAGKLGEGRDHLIDVDIDGSITLKCVLKKYSLRVLTGFIWLEWKPCEHGSELSGCMKGGNLLIKTLLLRLQSTLCQT